MLVFCFVFSPLGTIKDTVEAILQASERIHASAQEVRDSGFSKRSSNDITNRVSQEMELINHYVAQSRDQDPLFDSRLNLPSFIEDLRSLFDLVDLLAKNTKERARLVNEARPPAFDRSDSDSEMTSKIEKSNFFNIHKISLSLLDNAIQMPFILFFYNLGNLSKNIEALKPLYEFSKELVQYSEDRNVRLSSADMVRD